MIRPIVEFGDVLYYSCTLSTGQQIENIQRQSAIICCGAYRHTSYSNLLTELGWEPLHKRRFTHKLILFYKIIHNIYPKYLYNLLNFRQLSNYNLRQTSTLQPRFTRFMITHNSFFPSTTIEWLKLPTSTQNALSVASFKSLLRPRIFKNKYIK